MSVTPVRGPSGNECLCGGAVTVYVWRVQVNSVSPHLG